ncbi:RNA 2',3'-cyclic phosphodiesterase [Motiliproteus coralliicola]|uniref:RNA 2',3'-cyclic phosphodiesterase n=1 Tax=Motiliproteus coralliicola TaxID=2283196 RepID=A0A369WKQ2_9GAMM|nr:RNA 2',3'-cyclic phosphodiesterase [Motiliproteus coralliicola]RDE22648.1 RNA 2',3'-cyclic phosphodiesterase [Motiliproteus coralliicola]
MRLFTAIEPPVQLLPQLTKLCQGVPSIRWSDPNQLHLTLVFIGEVPDTQLKPISEALGQIEFATFELRCRRIGLFRSGSLWLGVEPCQPLQQLQQKQQRILQRFPSIRIRSRRFLPHWTLGRFRRQQRPDLSSYIERNQDLDINIPVDRYILKSSRLLEQGAQHRSEYEYLAE